VPKLCGALFSLQAEYPHPSEFEKFALAERAQSECIATDDLRPWRVIFFVDFLDNASSHASALSNDSTSSIA
jgi:hypothetical protein